jgi:hypothetical protein
MPRTIAGPAVRGEDFWGRTGDVEALWRLLETGSVLLSAPRRFGKTSLMCALHDNPRPGWAVVMLDVEFVESPAEFLTELAAALVQDEVIGRRYRRGGLPGGLARWVSTVVEEVGVGFAAIGEAKLRLRTTLPAEPDWPAVGEQLVGALRNGKERVIVVIDEFPLMVGSLLKADAAGATRFLRWFRSLRQPTGPDKTAFLLGGSVNLEPLLEVRGQESLLNDLHRYRLEPLGADAALRFVRAVLTAEGVEFEPGVPQAICEAVDAGVQFYLQVMIAECLAISRAERRKLYTEEVPGIYRNRVLGPANRQRFSHALSRLREHYGAWEQPARVVLSSLAQGPEPLEGIAQTLSLAGWPEVDVEGLLAQLEADYYLVRQGRTVRFAHGLLRDWWVLHAPVAR